MSKSANCAASNARRGVYSSRAVFARIWRRTCARLLVAFAVGCTSPVSIAATQVQIDATRDKAAAWLILNQKGDGFWAAGGGGTAVPVTGQAGLGLIAAGVRGFPVLTADGWLLNNKADSVDALSRSLLARSLSSINETSGLQQLLSWANDDMNSTSFSLWGAYPKYTTSLADTALAWRAIIALKFNVGTTPPSLFNPNLLNLFCNLVSGVQRSDGAWPNNIPPGKLFGQTAPPVTPAVGSAGSVLATTQMILMMRLARTDLPVGSFTCGASNVGTLVDNSVNAAVTWLTTTVRNVDGGVGENGISTLLATAQAYQALQAAAPANPVTGALLDYMIARQSGDGSWNADPMITGLMLEAVAKVASAVVDTDGDGIPNSIELAMGRNPNVADSRQLADKPTGSGRAGITLPLAIANEIPINVPFTANVSATGGTGPTYTWSVTGGMLPPGLALSASTTATATISGTPTALGLYAFEYSIVDNGTGAVAKTIGQLTVVRSTFPNARTGDINADGKVDLADVILAQRIALGQLVPTAQQRAAADVAPVGEPDGIINASDVLRILRKALGIDSF